MIRSVTVRNLRGLRSAELRDLTRLVVLVGPNGSGKSALLEAIDIGASPTPGHAVGRSVRRRTTTAPSFRWLLWQGAEDHRGEICVSLTTGARRRLLIERAGSTFYLEVSTEDGEVSQESSGSVEFQADDTYRQSFTDPIRLPGLSSLRLVDLIASFRMPLHQLYSAAVEQGRRDEALAVVRTLLPGTTGVEILTEHDRPVLHVVLEDHSVPADLAGDGVAALLRLSLELASRRQGTILMEEPELHLHPAAIHQSARAMAAACERGLQIILTTHSLELIDALLEVRNETPPAQLAVCRTRLAEGELKTHLISGPDLDLARGQIESDLELVA